jgi:endonuclease/exonuclease/phosphatase (EEP) superfamily protein YafD
MTSTPLSEAAQTERLHGWKRLALDLAWISLFFAGAGLLTRLTVRDALPGLALFHYMAPGPVLAIFFLFSGLCAGATGRKKWRNVTVGCALVVFTIWWFQNRVDARPSPLADVPAERRFRLVHWNIAGPFAAWSQIRDALAAEQPDLAVLIEAKAVAGTRFNLQEGALDDLELISLDHGLMILSRWPVEQLESGEIPGRFRWGTLVVRHPAGAFRLSLADLGSNPLLPRRGQIEGWLAATRRADGLPEVIAGDFNTPLDSLWFRGLRQTHLHAFTTAGHGLHVTWPNPLPVLALDHVWLRELYSEKAAIRFNWHSDHGMLVIDLVR